MPASSSAAGLALGCVLTGRTCRCQPSSVRSSTGRGGPGAQRRRSGGLTSALDCARHRRSGRDDERVGLALHHVPASGVFRRSRCLRLSQRWQGSSAWSVLGRAAPSSTAVAVTGGTRRVTGVRRPRRWALDWQAWRRSSRSSTRTTSRSTPARVSGAAGLAGLAGALAVTYLCLLVVLTPSVPGSRRRRLTWTDRARLTELTTGQLLPGVAILLSAILLVSSAIR